MMKPVLLIAIAALLYTTPFVSSQAAPQIDEEEKVTCSVAELSPCASAIRNGGPPTALCCSKLREQKPCLCGYIRNPSLRPFVNSPNARKVGAACGVSYPSC